MQTSTPSNKSLRAKEAAAFLGIGKSTFWRWVQEGRIPEGIKLSPRATVWTVETLEHFRSLCAEKGRGRYEG